MTRTSKLEADLNDRHLNQIDKFLEGGLDALSLATRKQAVEQAPAEPGLKAVVPPSDPDRARPQRKVVRAPEAKAERKRPKINIDLEDEGLKALVWTVHPDSEEQDILEVLSRHKVTTGISLQTIRKALETVRKTGQPMHDVVVAQGIAPKPPVPPRVEHCPPAGLKSIPPAEPISQALKLKDRDKLLQVAATLRVWAVGPGDRVAVCVTDSGLPGTNVLGKPIPPPPLEENESDKDRFEPGPGVARAPDGSDYTARIYGYAVYLPDGRVSVLSPIWIASDGLTACLLNLPAVPGSRAPQPVDLYALLADAGIYVGIDEVAIGSFCDRFTKGQTQELLIVLAHGRKPVFPPDAVLKFDFPHQPQAGTVLPDGSIDYRERNVFPSVKEGARLMECPPPVPGTPGLTVRGETIPVPDPTHVELVAGENVRREEENGTVRLYAGISGGVQVSEVVAHNRPVLRHTVSVRNIAQVSGDVSYETGNLDHKGSVDIRGTVTSGFRVVATGDIAISGSIETGAFVQAGGNIVVRQGIAGRQTRVIAQGTVMARFVHDARIEAGKDVVIGSYIHGAFVRAGGRVLMEGRGGSGGSIAGGEVWAMQGIVCRNAGSELSTSTVLAVGVAPDVFAKCEKARQAAQQAEALLRTLLKSIGLETLKMEEIRALISRASARKKTILHYVQKANELAKARQKYLDEQADLDTQIMASSQKAAIDVTDTAYARVSVRIGNAQVQIPDSLKHVRFAIDPTKNVGIGWTGL